MNTLQQENSTGSADSSTDGPRPYHDGFELLDDLLLRLDRRIEQLTQHVRHETDDSCQPSWLGVAITSDDVARLLHPNRQGAFSFDGARAEAGFWEQVQPRVEATRRAGIALPLDLLHHRFGLNAFEVDAVIVCLAPELDRKYEKLYAYLNDDVTRKQATASLLVHLVASAADPRYLRYLSPPAPLLRWSILSWMDEPARGENTPGLGRCLCVERGPIQFLLEEPYLENQVESVWDRSVAPKETKELWSRFAHLPQLDRLVASIVSKRHESSEQPVVCVIAGRTGSGRRKAVESACQEHGLGLIALDCRLIVASPRPELVLRRGYRDAVLHGVPVLLTHAEALTANPDQPGLLRHTLERLMDDHGSLLIANVDRHESLEGWFAGYTRVDVTVPPSTYQDRMDQWSHLIERLELDHADVLAEDLAVKFRLTPGQIGEAFTRALDAHWLAGEAGGWSSLLQKHAARVATPHLGGLARRISPIHGMDDIVLPPRKRDTLRDVVRHVRHKRRVMQQWRFEESMNRGRGLTVLFSGPPGTGKTMAAEIIANELGMDLYCIDLSAVVSKYIGETEKNLARIFDEAETSDAILFFDEADALFGKRSEVRDAHDRYANIETNYLLQKIESYEGIAILATNLRRNLDEAFLRRVRIVLEFPVPSADDRLRIWRKSLPEEVPLGGDVDFDFLAQAFDFSGGSIRNVALNAAFLAADREPAEVSMEHLIRSTQKELDKTGKRSVKDQFGVYFDLLEPPIGSAATA